MPQINKLRMLGILLALSVPGAACAEAIEKAADGTVTWQAGIDGATLEFNPDGSWKKIYSKYSHPVTIADKRGVKTAMVIAEEKAKANIVRYLNQHVSSKRVVNEFENTLSKTTQEKGAGGESVSSVDQRAISQSLNELTESMSAGTLTGVVVLENGFDEKEKEAWVVVGLSRKSMAAARATQDALTDAQRPASGSGEPPAAAPLPDRAGSVIRRGNSDF